MDKKPYTFQYKFCLGFSKYDFALGKTQLN